MTSKTKELWDWTKAGIIAIVITVTINTFLFAPVVVDGKSMLPTLKDRDRMIVNKLGEIKRFDVIVFHSTEENNFVKRVIGLPGDEIEYKNDILYINGEAYDEPYLDTHKKDEDNKLMGPLTEDFTLYEKIGRMTVPDESLFVLGDNRRNSKDSRSIGAIPLEEVVGKTNLTYWPMSEIGLLESK